MGITGMLGMAYTKATGIMGMAYTNDTGIVGSRVKIIVTMRMLGITHKCSNLILMKIINRKLRELLDSFQSDTRIMGTGIPIKSRINVV